MFLQKTFRHGLVRIVQLQVKAWMLPLVFAQQAREVAAEDGGRRRQTESNIFFATQPARDVGQPPEKRLGKGEKFASGRR